MLHFTPFPIPFPSHPIVQSRSSASVAIITFLVVATADTRMPFGSPFFSPFLLPKGIAMHYSHTMLPLLLARMAKSISATIRSFTPFTVPFHPFPPFHPFMPNKNAPRSQTNKTQSVQ